MNKWLPKAYPKMSDLINSVVKILDYKEAFQKTNLELAREILNLKVKVKCDICKGRGLRESKKLVVNQGEVVQEPNFYQCHNCKLGYIIKTLKEMVGE